MTRKAPANLLQGQAGVYQVASQLLLRGFNPMFPAVDHGADLVLEGGCRVQVKSAIIRTVRGHYYSGCYWFKLSQTKLVNRVQKLLPVADWTTFCDVVIFWGINENRFWIVPSQLLNGKQCLVLGNKTPNVGSHKELDIEKIHKLHKQGLTQVEIAASLGVGDRTIARRLRGEYVVAERSFYKVVRQYEDKWEVLDEFLQIDSSVSASLLSSPQTTMEEF